MQSPFVGDKKEKHSEQGNESSKEKAAFTEATFLRPFYYVYLVTNGKAILRMAERELAVKEGDLRYTLSFLAAKETDTAEKNDTVATLLIDYVNNLTARRKDR